MGAIFIAYSSEDVRFLTNLSEQLKVRTKHEIWVAAIDVEKEWRKEIEDRLNQADSFVLLISKSLLARPEPRRILSGAIDLADQKKLKITPVIIGELKHEELPIIIRNIQCIRFQPFENMLDELLKALFPEMASSSRAAFDQYVASVPKEMVKLGEQVLMANWPNRSEILKEAKYIASTLESKNHPVEACFILNKAIDMIESIPTADKTKKKCTESKIGQVLIFGPGQRSEDYRYRKIVREILEENFETIFPEDFADINKLMDWYKEHGIILKENEVKLSKGSSATKELILADYCNYVYIILMSPGAISEFSQFYIDRIADKIRVFIPMGYYESDSYISFGPLKVFDNKYKQVYPFKDESELRDLVTGRRDSDFEHEYLMKRIQK
ncbi:MAG: TIR domain-containing protein [Methanosarcinales archaeon]